MKSGDERGTKVIVKEERSARANMPATSVRLCRAEAASTANNDGRGGGEPPETGK